MSSRPVSFSSGSCSVSNAACVWWKFSRAGPLCALSGLSFNSGFLRASFHRRYSSSTATPLDVIVVWPSPSCRSSIPLLRSPLEAQFLDLPLGVHVARYDCEVRKNLQVRLAFLHSSQSCFSISISILIYSYYLFCTPIPHRAPCAASFPDRHLCVHHARCDREENPAGGGRLQVPGDPACRPHLCAHQGGR